MNPQIKYTRLLNAHLLGKRDNLGRLMQQNINIYNDETEAKRGSLMEGSFE
jgi:hypothetical protein